MMDAMPTEGKSQQAYRELKRLILTLELAPGQLLHEPSLMATLGCGRTPVREAIQRLAAEKLVVARPRQTAFVAPILAHELAEIVEVRLMLEVPAARMAAERGTKQERLRLCTACENFCKHARADEGEGILAGDAAIHGLIASMSRNSFLAEYSERLASVSQRVWWLSVQNVSRDDAFVRCHDDLTRTICSGDTEAAAQAATDHVVLFQTRLGRLIQAVSPDVRGGEKAFKQHGTAA